MSITTHRMNIGFGSHENFARLELSRKGRCQTVDLVTGNNMSKGGDRDAEVCGATCPSHSLLPQLRSPEGHIYVKKARVIRAKNSLREHVAFPRPATIAVIDLTTVTIKKHLATSWMDSSAMPLPVVSAGRGPRVRRGRGGAREDPGCAPEQPQ